MSAQEHIPKKPLATNINQSKDEEFASGFAQTEQDTASQQQSQDLKTQLNQAERFGHSLSKMPLPTSPQPTAALQTKAPASGPGNLFIQREAIPEDEDELQMKPEKTAQLATQSQPIQQATSVGSDHSLPKTVRAKMENSFGASFSDVSVHTESAQAKAIGALAYTQGSQIHFAPGQYNPNSPAGQALLGHELTHVVQQRAGRVPTPPQSKGLPINADSALEQEADRLGARAAQGQQVQVPGAIAKATPVQRSAEPVRDLSFGSLLAGDSSMDDPTMDLNTYKTLNQHVESLLPQLQQQVMKQPMPGGMQNAVQCAKGGGGGKAGGMMSKLNPMSKGGGGEGGDGGGGGGGGLLGAVGGAIGGILGI